MYCINIAFTNSLWCIYIRETRQCTPIFYLIVHLYNVHETESLWYYFVRYGNDITQWIIFTILHEIITARFFDSLIFCYRKMLPYFRNLHHKLPTKHLKLICWILELVHKHKNCSREKPLCCIVTFVYLLTRVESSFVLYRNWWTCLCL